MCGLLLSPFLGWSLCLGFSTGAPGPGLLVHRLPGGMWPSPGHTGLGRDLGSEAVFQTLRQTSRVPLLCGSPCRVGSRLPLHPLSGCSAMGSCSLFHLPSSPLPCPLSCGFMSCLFLHCHGGGVWKVVEINLQVPRFSRRPLPVGFGQGRDHIHVGHESKDSGL